MLTGHTWVAIQYRLAGFSEGQNVATEYRWAGRQEHAAALRWKRDGHSIFVSASPQRCPNPPHHQSIADYAPEQQNGGLPKSYKTLILHLSSNF